MKAIAFLSVLALVACGGSSPSSPTPIAPRLALSGAWTGTAALTIDGRSFTNAITRATLTHTAQALTGDFTGADGATGTITATVASETPGAAVTGTLTMETASADPSVRCRVSGPLTGTAEMASVRLTAATVTLTGCSGAARDFIVTLTR